MHHHSINSVLSRIRTTAFHNEIAALTDEQLVERCIALRDEAAFEALVNRHGPMVLAVCRRVLSNHQDAEDAFQATFLVFVRKASSIRPRSKVGNWLYGVAYRAALKAKVAAARRGERERQVSKLPEPATVESGLWVDLLPILDEELNALPEKFRLPIVLCDLEGKTRKVAAAQLGWPEGTVAGRLAEGRNLLAKRLMRQGLPVSGAVLAVLMSQNAMAAGVSAQLAQSTLAAAKAMLAGQSIPGAAGSIAHGVVQAMLLKKLRSLVFAAIALAMLTLGGILLASWRPSAEGASRLDAARNDAPGQAQEKRAAPAPAKRAAAKEEQAKNQLEAELRKLQGAWWWSTVEQFGNNPRFAFPVDYYFEFHGESFVAYDRVSNVERMHGNIRVDPMERTIDLLVGDKEQAVFLAGRYGWKDNLLQLAYDPQNKHVRPKEMKSHPKSSVQIWTCLPLELQGTWDVTSHVTNGKAANDKFLAQQHQWTFAGHAVTMKDKDGLGRKGIITFDPTAKPKELTLRLEPGFPPGRGDKPKEEFSAAIYDIKDDTLTICYTVPPNLTPGKKFASTAESMTGVVTLKRPRAKKENDEQTRWSKAVNGLQVGIQEQREKRNDRAVDKLLATLQTGDDEAKSAAIEAIGKLGAAGEDAVPALVNFITKYPGGELDAQAIIAVGKIGPAAKAALPALHNRANSMFNGQREPVENACIAIGKIGGWTLEATCSVLPLSMGHTAYFAANPDATLPQLLKLLKDDHAATRLGAIDAWRRLVEERDELLKKYPKIRGAVVDFAAASLTSKDAHERRRGADLYRTIVPERADAIIPIVVRLQIDGMLEWREADRMLSGRGNHGTVHENLRVQALPLLVAGFADASPAAHAQLVDYLGSSLFRRHTDWLPQALADKNARIRWGAAATARLTGLNKATEAALRERLKDDEFLVRYHAAAALNIYDRNDPLPPILANLIEGLRHEDPTLRFDAISRIRSLGNAAEPATPALLQALNDPKYVVRNEAADVLLALDVKHAKSVLAMVQRTLRDGGKDYQQTLHVLRLAKKLGAESAALVPDLLALMEADSNWIGPAAAILEKLGADGKPAIPALQKRLESASGQFSSSAELAHVALALAKLGAPDHARATRVLLPFTPRSRQSNLLTYYFPHFPNETVRELTKLLSDPKLRPAVFETLSRMNGRGDFPKDYTGDPAKRLTAEVKNELKKGLVSLLDDKDLGTKVSAMTTMRTLKIVPPDDKVIALVREAVASENHLYSMAAILRGNEAKLVPVFIEAAASRTDPMRHYGALSEANPHVVVPILIRIAKTESPGQCVQAAWGLAALSRVKVTDDMRAEATTALLARLPDLKSQARGDVAMAILNLNSAAPPREAVVAVGEMLVDKDVKNHAPPVGALRMIGKNAAPAAEHLRMALKDTNPYVRLEAAICLVTLDKKYTGEALPLACAALEEKSAVVPKKSHGNLGMALHLCTLLGAEARPLVPRLLEISQSRDAQVAILAGKAAVAADKDSIPKVAKNFGMLLESRVGDHESTNVHRLLREWGKAATSADEHVATLLHRDYDDARHVAVTLIMLQGPSAEKGIELMRRGLRSGDGDGDCGDALHHFAVLKSHGNVFLPELRKLLDGPNEYDRLEALRAIGHIGPDAKELLPDLRRRLKAATSDSLRSRLEETIKKITP